MNTDINDLQDIMIDLIALSQTQKRLTLLRNLDYNRVHGSDSTHLENVLPMLNDFGLNYFTEAFKCKTPDITNISDVILKYSYYEKIEAYPFFIKSKFPVNGAIDFAIERINTIYNFTHHNNYDIYDESDKYKGVPIPFRDRPIIKPDIAYGDMCKLPMIYDIVMLAEVYDYISSDLQDKINNIINYIISPEYDVVLFGYGILASTPKKYHSMGWDCKKPFNDKQDYSYQNLHRLLLYSHFPIVVKSSWFHNAIDYLSQFETKNQTYTFPVDYLSERDSNWVLGSRMSLAENRRKKNWVEIESTFYMLKLLNCFTVY